MVAGSRYRAPQPLHRANARCSGGARRGARGGEHWQRQKAACVGPFLLQYFPRRPPTTRTGGAAAVRLAPAAPAEPPNESPQRFDSYAGPLAWWLEELGLSRFVEDTILPFLTFTDSADLQYHLHQQRYAMSSNDAQAPLVPCLCSHHKLSTVSLHPSRVSGNCSRLVIQPLYMRSPT